MTLEDISATLSVGLADFRHTEPHGKSMKPTPDQIAHLKIWLDARMSALFAGDPMPRLPLSIERYMSGGVDFGMVFQEFGFTANGLGLLPNFHEIHRKK